MSKKLKTSTSSHHADHVVRSKSAKRKGLPPLDRTIQTFKHQLLLTKRNDGTAAVATASATDLYVSAMAFVCHLKTDQARLYRIRKEQGDDAICPTPDKIPAMTAVLQDIQLFQALLNLLQPGSTSPSTGMAMMMMMGTGSGGPLDVDSGPAGVGAGSRKRSLSYLGDGDASNTLSSINGTNASNGKSAKLTHSPMPSSRHKLMVTSRGSNAVAASRLQQQQQQPTVNFQVLAVTILYAALQHLDHWPAPLVKAYTEDCFGSRSWVEDERCQLLVQNLALAHHDEEDENDTVEDDHTTDDDTSNQKGNRIQQKLVMRSSSSFSSCDLADKGEAEAISRLVAQAYRKLAGTLVDATYPASVISHEREKTISNNSNHSDTPLSPSNSQHRRGSMSSTSSSVRRQRSMSIDSVEASSVLSRQASVSSPKPTKKRKALGGLTDEASNDGGMATLAGTSSKSKVKQSIIVTTPAGADSDGSSSSGEEDEEVVLRASKADNGKKSNEHMSDAAAEALSTHPSNLGEAETPSESGGGSVSAPSGFKSSPIVYPVVSSRLSLKRVRNRYVGENRVFAHEFVVQCLSERLISRQKQNSGLLQSLPSFTAIPAVRRLITENLEKWLQSAALSGLARNLFASTVKHFKKLDPPLDDDLQSINCILNMRLKPNQLNAHIENITSIARRLPSASVINHIYSKLLGELLLTTDAMGPLTSTKLKMIGAIHTSVSPTLSYDGIAAALLNMLLHRGSTGNGVVSSAVVEDTNQIVKKLRALIRALASEFGSSFDGAALIDALLSFDVNSDTWTIREEENKARLMLQCATLSVTQFLKERNKKGALSLVEAQLRKRLISVRKQILTWCCMDYGPLHSSQVRQKRAKHTLKGEGENDTIGAGLPNYGSALSSSTEEKIPVWLNTMRCLLFMEDGSTTLMKRFVFPRGMVPDEEPDWTEECARIDLCTKYGSDVNDDMMWIILRSCASSRGGIEPEMAILLVEHLFEGCSKTRPGKLRLKDPMLIWELYNPVQYSPPDPKGRKDGEKLFRIPRLAYSGLWWRVTMIALVMCGCSTNDVGSVAWKEHPTLQSLIKMVTSNRYRFPTVDSNDSVKDEMKRAEQGARDEETRVAEYIFFPPCEDKKKDKKAGSRVSRRLMKQQQEREAADELAEKNRRKKLLRMAQKSIMLWDPDGPARKPTREAADLLLSVEALFGLGDAFQRAVSPDFLLLTVGKTTRDAIERAYDWLIPIISRLPDTIARLPSSASCFLLLKAYGADGDERSQLKELSTPLLLHVKDSLKGLFGESDAVKAFDLLMSDVASPNPDRRRCARRVLKDAVVPADASSVTASSWMTAVLELDHAKNLVKDSIWHMSKAASFERGGTLRSLVVGLHSHIAFAKENDVQIESDFPSLLMRLMSGRPSVFSEAMDSFSDLRLLAISVIHGLFSSYVKSEISEAKTDDDNPVEIRLHPSPLSTEGQKLTIPLTVLQSISVILSIWKEDNSEKERDMSTAINDMVGALTRDDGESSGLEAKSDVGLISAKMVKDGSSAISVESWIMLAKARSDKIARRAALSAPAGFLPRLLLCTALPRSSFLAMLDRLGRLGDGTSEKDKVYLPLMNPPASSEWDIGRVGTRREMSRKLLGRLSAYSRANQINTDGQKWGVSTTFMEWIHHECLRDGEKPKKKVKKSKAHESATLQSLDAASSILANHIGEFDSAPAALKLDDHMDVDLIQFMSP